MDFRPEAFIENLSYMGLGMLGIFIVMGLLIAATTAINALSGMADKDDKH